MDILLVHNYYQQPGGEDQVFSSEAQLLEKRGHKVMRYEVRNDAIRSQSLAGTAARTFWNHKEYKKLREVMRRDRPQLVHVHNTFPLISPAIYYAARAEQVPVVQTLHNYRLLCPAATLFRNGEVCHECTGKRIPWPAVKHACYHQSTGGSAVVAGMLSVHRALGTWNRMVDAYIALTQFSRDLFVKAGFPAHKMFVKPNFTENPSLAWRPAGGGAVYAGRLTPEKGIETLLDAWRQLGGTVPLRIVGDGPLADQVKAFAAEIPNVTYEGWVDRARLKEIFQESSFLVVPSTWYEVFGLNVLEAYACGLPVIASRIGGLAEIVHDGQTGLQFAPGDSAGLAAKVRWAVSHSAEWERMRRQARSEFELKYSDEPAYRALMQVYHAAIGRVSESSLDSQNATPGVRLVPEGPHSASMQRKYFNPVNVS
jgi:glycosyltransferase involved in cell wall biosynthesis